MFTRLDGGGFLSDEEQELLKKGIYNPKRISLKQARELYPEWYERRIIQGHKSGRWYVKRDLYDWWKKQISEKVSVGHRYFCLMALAVYAAKCNIEEEEFMKDLESFVEPFDGISYTRNEDDRFTMDDALDAAAAYRECYCTFPIEDLRDITGIEIARNKTRKFKKQDKHLEEARAIRDVRQKREGRIWNENGIKNNKLVEIFEWRKNNPEGSKYACAKELGISKPTVSLVIGGGHSIGIPLAVAADYSFAAKSATMTLHPIRTSGTLITAEPTFEYMKETQERVVDFIVEHSHAARPEIEEKMNCTSNMANDVGTLLFGPEAVKMGLVDGIGTLAQALGKLRDMIEK